MKTVTRIHSIAKTLTPNKLDSQMTRPITFMGNVRTDTQSVIYFSHYSWKIFSHDKTFSSGKVWIALCWVSSFIINACCVSTFLQSSVCILMTWCKRLRTRDWRQHIYIQLILFLLVLHSFPMLHPFHFHPWLLLYLEDLAHPDLQFFLVYLVRQRHL